MITCECGCGMVVNTGKRFRQGHWAKTPEGVKVNSETHFKGYSSEHGDGYKTVNVGVQKGHKLEHRAVMEKLIGRPLSSKERVHHIDEDRGNNAPDNLVLCANDAEHQLLHLKARALKLSGNENYRQCYFCKQWDDPINLYIPPRSGCVEHRRCGNVYRKQRTLTRSLPL